MIDLAAWNGGRLDPVQLIEDEVSPRIALYALVHVMSNVSSALFDIVYKIEYE
jgi:hypothetical protein